MDLPDFVKESVPQIQILCTFQARLTKTFVLFRLAIQNLSKRRRTRATKRNPSRSWGCQFTGGETRIRTGDKGFAGLCLTTWPSRHMKKAETNPAEKSWSGLRGSNPRPQPWQGCALPTALSPRTRGIIYASSRLSASVNFKIVKLF